MPQARLLSGSGSVHNFCFSNSRCPRGHLLPYPSFPRDDETEVSPSEATRSFPKPAQFESPIINDLFVPNPNWRENYDTKGQHLYDSMGSRFCQLCEAGKLDRKRLLKTTIQAIGRMEAKLRQSPCKRPREPAHTFGSCSNSCRQYHQGLLAGATTRRFVG